MITRKGIASYFSGPREANYLLLWSSVI